jgi:hypothetical protein
MALLYLLGGTDSATTRVRQTQQHAGGNIAVGLGVGLWNAVLSDTHECLCEYVEQKTKTSQIFEIIGHLI